jgi:hypothetical protein
VAGAGRVVLGSDYPFDMGIDDPVGRLDAATGLSLADWAAIRGQNAAALLGLLKPGGGGGRRTLTTAAGREPVIRPTPAGP